MTIMIVDDHAEMRRTIRTVIASTSRENHEFIECADGDDAVERFALQSPDWVIMDVQLQKTDGFRATERIIQLDPEARVVFVTGFSSPAGKERAKRLGAKGFVSKDDLMDLLAVLSL